MRRFAKLCDVRDFEDPDVLRMVRDILPERDPLAHVERKVWEFAMLGLFLEEYGDGHTAPELGVSCQGGTPLPDGSLPGRGTDA